MYFFEVIALSLRGAVYLDTRFGRYYLKLRH